MIGCLLTQALAFLTVFVYATHVTQAIAFEWKPGFTLTIFNAAAAAADDDDDDNDDNDDNDVADDCVQQPESFGFSSGDPGCELCACGAASFGRQCDVESGQCECRRGTTGRRCDECEDGFWNYGPLGCQRM